MLAGAWPIIAVVGEFLAQLALIGFILLRRRPHSATTLAWIVVILVLPLLGFVGYLATMILRESEGTEKMKEISLAIRQGAMAFLRREFIVLAVFTVVVFIILAVFIDPKPLVAVAYLCGTVTSALAGWLGMNIATKANARTAQAAIGSWAK